jgi:hypothetical protein
MHILATFLYLAVAHFLLLSELRRRPARLDPVAVDWRLTFAVAAIGYGVVSTLVLSFV